jgi:hypothetical protein
VKVEKYCPTLLCADLLFWLLVLVVDVCVSVELRPEYVGRIPNQLYRVHVACDMYKIVVGQKPNYFSRLINLEWLSLSDITTPSLVVYLINEVRQGSDLRSVYLSRCANSTSTEIETFSDHVRDVYTLNLHNCTGKSKVDCCVVLWTEHWADHL